MLGRQSDEPQSHSQSQTEQTINKDASEYIHRGVPMPARKELAINARANATMPVKINLKMNFIVFWNVCDAARLLVDLLTGGTYALACRTARLMSLRSCRIKGAGSTSGR